jgi:hypothetical protein
VETSVELAFPLEMTMTVATDRDATEADLVVASRRGDDAAFAALVRRHRNRVFGLAGRFFRRSEDVVVPTPRRHDP